MAGVRLRLGLVVLHLAMLAAGVLQAQTEPPTALIADKVIFDNTDTLIAEGNVQVFSEGRELRATRLIYNSTEESLVIEGPILLRDGTESVVVAESGLLDTELETGILNAARVLVQERLQITGAQLERREGGFNDFRRVVATSCEVCKPGQAPLWQVRARRVIQDDNALRIYFYDAQFRVFNVPVFYLPVLRVPDPRVDRANGFLLPSIRASSLVGDGLRVPYFITLGDSADLTLAPYITDGTSQTVELRYRQLFRGGGLTAEGAIAQDDLTDAEYRGYLFAQSGFALPRGFQLELDYEYTSDRRFTFDYDYSSKDILDSAVRTFRVREDELIDLSFTGYQSLRQADIDMEFSRIADLDYRRSWQPDGIGGLLDFRLVGQARFFDGGDDQEEPNVDVVRGTVDWQRDWTFGPGLRFGTEAELNLDYRRIIGDPEYPEHQTAFTPTFAADLSWPLSSPDPRHSGAAYLLEPIAQVIWTRPDTLEGPNQDSTDVSLDTGNLFALNRFPGLDRYETGLRGNLALRWGRIAPDGFSFGVTAGRVLRDSQDDSLDETDFLDGSTSDWLAQIDLDFGRRLRLRNLLLIDDDGEPSFNEARAGWTSNRLSVNAAYVWQEAETSESLDSDLSELALTGGIDVTQSISASFDLRHDFTLDRTNRVDLGLTYENECIRVDLTAKRRFTSNDGNETDITYGLQVELAGFGSEIGRNRARRVCTSRGRIG